AWALFLMRAKATPARSLSEAVINFLIPRPVDFKGLGVTQLHERRNRGLDPLALALRDEFAQHLEEMRLLCAGDNVLPAVGLAQRHLQFTPVAIAERPPAGFGEV